MTENITLNPIEQKQPEVLELVETFDDILDEPLERFDFESPPVNPVDLANDLIYTMSAHNGLGLAANQCGLPYRVFVLRSMPTLVCFNPILLDVSEEQVKLEEGCLSYPNFAVKVKRPKLIKVRYTDAWGETHTQKFADMTARAFQHELDHLNGVRFVDRASKMDRHSANRRYKKTMREMK